MNKDEMTIYLMEFALQVLEDNDLLDVKNSDNWTIGVDMQVHLDYLKAKKNN